MGVKELKGFKGLLGNLRVVEGLFVGFGWRSGGFSHLGLPEKRP